MIMRALMRLASTSYAVAAAKHRAERALRRIMMLVVATLIAAIGLGFLVAALWTWVATETTAMIANLIVGGLFLVTSAIVYVTFKMANRRQPEPAVLADPVDSLARQLRSMSDINPPTLANLMVVVGAGFLLGRVVSRR